MASISKRPNGTWCGEIRKVGQKRKTFYGTTKKEVEKKINDYLTDVAVYGTALDKQNPTLQTWVHEFLFVSLHPTLAASSFERAMCTYNNHILNITLGQQFLKDIQQKDLQKFLNEKKHLSTSSLKKIKELLNNSFKYAISNNLIRINPVTDVKLPKSDVETKGIEILTINEQRAYIASTPDELYGLPCLVALFTGMRLGEVMALKWNNIDFNRQQLTVCESYKRVKKYDTNGVSTNTLDKKTPKTDKGIRTIPLSDVLVKELRKYKLSSPNSTENLVFCTRNGTPLNDANIRRSHSRICKRSNIRPVSFHALRHTFATRMIENGVDVKTVSELLGHTTVELTLNRYVHSTDDAKLKAINVQNNFYNELMSAR